MRGRLERIRGRLERVTVRVCVTLKLLVSDGMGSKNSKRE